MKSFQIRNRALIWMYRRSAVWPRSKPVVSFTFDDFPRSAYRVAGAVLKDYNARGTYYTATGLMNKEYELGTCHSEQDLIDLVADGHELGCHSFSHLHYGATAFSHFHDDVIRNQQALNAVLPGYILRQFAYPLGEVTLAAKKTVGRRFASCRGIAGGIHVGRIDLNLLRANRLYSATTEFRNVESLVHENARQKGWLIFYTHDVCESPSPYGCTPRYFEAALRCAAESGSEILTIGQTLKERGLNSDECI